MALRSLHGGLGHYLPGTFLDGRLVGRDDTRLSSNVYVITNNGECAIVDTGVGRDALRGLTRHLTAHRLTPRWVLLTHDHHDHVSNGPRLQGRYRVPLLIHPADRELLQRSPGEESDEVQPPAISVDGTVEDGDVLDLGGMDLMVLHTPGHSPGSISVYVPSRAALFAGDLPLWIGPGRRHPLGDYRAWRRSMGRIRDLDLELVGWGHSLPTVGPRACYRFLDGTLERAAELEDRLVQHLRCGAMTIPDLVCSVMNGGSDIYRRLMGASLHAILHALRDEGCVQAVRGEDSVLWRLS